MSDTTPPSPQQAALQQARDALTGWMDQPDTAAAYDASMERAIAAVAAIDAAVARIDALGAAATQVKAH